ncbi:cytochrome c oxidase assembly protein COX16 homolog, mitochondrial [Malaya genurostris]|uniref:cytochrome c oxidase assembly protein COX16 homolog, mitochondrial n=1 Tax=Malaya genurostris TaxID=325434 RepID=UPI0026F3FDAE|nr:cytochrome c oxidase assembly protein COX16 homolog, mitochondrial [Malaya genurostris]
MNTFQSKLQYYTKQKFFRFGVPFLFLIVAGSFGLQQFAQLRYTYSKKGTLSWEEAESHGIHMKKPEEVTLETEYDKIKSIDINNWENVRGPRPWEEQTMKNQASH